MLFTREDRRILLQLHTLQSTILNRITTLEKQMATWQELSDNLSADVQKLSDTEAAVEALVHNMADQVAALRAQITDSTDMNSVKSNLESLETALRNSSGKLADLVVANTPAESPPSAAPVAAAAPSAPQTPADPTSGSAT